MSFFVSVTKQCESSDIAHDFEESDADDQADLLNEIGRQLDAYHDDERMAGYAKAIVEFLDNDGQAFVVALADAIKKTYG